MLSIAARGAPLDLLAHHGASAFVAWLRDEMAGAPSVPRAFEAARSLERMTGVSVFEEEAPVEHPDFEPGRYLARIDAATIAPADRIRFGKKLDIATTFAELANPSTHQGIRRSLCFQAAVLRGSPLPFDVAGWISTQRLALRTLAATPKAAA